MIYDKLSNLKDYKGINENLDTAIDFLINNDVKTLPMGKTVIDGDNVFVNVMDAQSQVVEEKFYEIHKKYADIQIDIQGVEAIKIGDVENETINEFDENTDFGKVDTLELTNCILGDGNFIVCMPSEPHMPCIKHGENTDVKKAVVKVLF